LEGEGASAYKRRESKDGTTSAMVMHAACPPGEDDKQESKLGWTAALASWAAAAGLQKKEKKGERRSGPRLGQKWCWARIEPLAL
jgi:hypothetical protein